MKKKTLALLAVLVLVIVGIIGGTLAWLTAKTEPVVNTFSTSDINITLEETTGQTYKMIPGWTITKDPKVTVENGSEMCWLFVKLDKSEDFDRYMEFEIAEGWNKGDGNNIPVNVYYRQINGTDGAQMGVAYSVLKDNQVTVKDNITKADMALINSGTKPTLTVTAYASQLYKSADEEFTAADAWKNVS